MLLIAGGFTTFLLFIALGVGALAFTALLDKALGKERALLVYALLLLGLTAFLLRARADDPGAVKPRTDPVLKDLPKGRTPTRDLTSRPAFVGTDEERRDAFERWSDTRPLAPVVVKVPPAIELEFPFPPTVPGLAPAARRPLRGVLPALPEDDTSTPLRVTPITFSEYVVKAEDLFDWHDTPSGRNYVSIVSINGVRASEPGFAPLRAQLLAGENLDRLELELANIGGEAQAAKVLNPAAAAKASKQNRFTRKASEFSGWKVRRSVQNLYEEQLRSFLGGEALEASRNVRGMLEAARVLEGVGASGKEQGEGWRKAVLLLERAYAVAQETLSPAERAEILVRLISGYRALNDEQAVLRALAAYAQAAPTSAQPRVWMGDLALRTLGLPEEALRHYGEARQLDPGSEGAALGQGDALTVLGRHKEAQQAYEKAGPSFEAQVRRAEAALRLGDLARAQSAADAALAQSNEAPRALLVRGAVQYAKGDLAAAKAAFEAAAASTAENGVWRAQAFYNLGLTCWRLAQTRAAVGAFEGCDAALRMGASPSRLPDETVSPALGRALVAYTLKPREAEAAAPPAAPAEAAAPAEGAPAAEPLSVRRDALGEYLAAARDEARRLSYREHVAGLLATQQGDTAGAIKSLRRALVMAPDATELDGWLALNHLRWAFARAARPDASGLVSETTRDPEERALDALLAQDAAAHFEAAVTFAARASATDAAADSRAVLAMLRETWVRLQAEHLSPRKRFEAAEAAADRVLAKSEHREHPAALCMRAFARYRLGGDPLDTTAESNYNKCQNDLNLVLAKVPDKEGVPWAAWRAYAVETLERVKHWRSLEEKVVSFEGLTQLTKEWQGDVAKGTGVSPGLDEGRIVFKGSVGKDGTITEPTVVLKNEQLFEKNTFESVSLKIRIPSQQDGRAVNKLIAFGVAVQGTTPVAGAGAGGIQGRHPGIGLFFDSGLMAARVGTGLAQTYREGGMVRVRNEQNAERPWPAGEWVEVRIVREDAKEGRLSLYVNDEEVAVLSDRVSGFRGVSGKAELWIGGWSAQAEQFHVEVKDIRIVRTRK